MTYALELEHLTKTYPGGVQALSRLNPIVYMISGFRYGFLGVSDVRLLMTVGVLIIFIALFYGLCWYLIQRGRGLRS